MKSKGSSRTNNKGRASNNGARGFGAALSRKPARSPKSLDETVARFGTRLPADAAATLCACGSGTFYSECCQPYHQGKRMPETPTRTLRTRFSAFAYRLPAHLIRTTHPSNRDWMEDSVAWARRLD